MPDAVHSDAPASGEAQPTGAAPEWLLHAAWIAPALCVAASAVYAMAFQSADTAPGFALSAIAAGLWIGASFAPRRCATLLEIGRLLTAPVGFVPWLLAALLPPPLVPARGGLGLGFTVCAALLAVAAAHQFVRRDRTRFAFTLVLLAINAALLVALNAFVGAFVLPARSHNNILTEHDPPLGWKLRRGLAVERRKEPYPSRETISRHGFRTAERPFEKPAGTQRIVALGDSHTEAYTEEFCSYWAVGNWNQKGQRAAVRQLVPQLRTLLQSRWAANE